MEQLHSEQCRPALRIATCARPLPPVANRCAALTCLAARRTRRVRRARFGALRGAALCSASRSIACAACGVEFVCRCVFAALYCCSVSSTSCRVAAFLFFAFARYNIWNLNPPWALRREAIARELLQASPRMPQAQHACACICRRARALRLLMGSVLMRAFPPACRRQRRVCCSGSPSRSAGSVGAHGAHPCSHVCTGTGLTPPTSAPGPA